MADTSRRLLLRVLVKLMLLCAAAIAIYVLLSSIDSADEDKPSQPIATLRVPLPTAATANPQRLVWAGGNLILLHRGPALLDALPRHDGRLFDPGSLSAKQPAAMTGPGRSLRPDLFLAYDRGTDMGCPLNWIPAGDTTAPLQPWPGGLRDNCRGSWYDAAGRVFKGQEAQRNLDIPPYRLLEGGLLEIGVSGDNAAPAN